MPLNCRFHGKRITHSFRMAFGATPNSLRTLGQNFSVRNSFDFVPVERRLQRVTSNLRRKFRFPENGASRMVTTDDFGNIYNESWVIPHTRSGVMLEHNFTILHGNKICFI